MKDIINKMRPHFITLLSSIALGTEICRSSMLILMAEREGVPILEGLQMSMILNQTAYFFPILVCLPCTMKMHEERCSGQMVFQLLRVERAKYVSIKLIQAIRSGARVVLGAVGVYLCYAIVLCLRFGKKMEFFSGIIGGDELHTNLYYMMIENGLGSVVFLINVIFLMLLAGFWNIFGVVISNFVLNRRIAIVSPFLFKRALEYIIPERLFFLNPAHLRMSGWVVELPLGGIGYSVCYITIAFLLGWLIISIKLSYEAKR